jgi:phosphate starvation-inducible membrane PsiE
MLIGFINVQHTPDEGILLISGAIVLLSFGVLMLRFGSTKYPSKSTGDSPTVVEAEEAV